MSTTQAPAFRLLLIMLLTSVLVRGENEHSTTCIGAGGACVQDDCAHELYLPGCGRDEICCNLQPVPVVPLNGCLWNSSYYRNGQSISNVCIDMTCIRGRWQTNGQYDGRCGKCTLSNDPHITTFDNTYFHWHGTCNYSISQRSTGYTEAFGIYGQFRQCNGLASCIDWTSFTDNPNTVLEVFNNGEVRVNNIDYVVQLFVEVVNVGGSSHPVLAWKDDDCYMFLGSQGFLLKICSNIIYLWAHQNLMDQIHGLCGTYNNNPVNDFMDRGGVIHAISSYPVAFPTSWLTADQQTDECYEGLPEGSEENAEPCSASEDVLHKIDNTCQRALGDVAYEGQRASDFTLRFALESCKSDLCIMKENGEKQEDIDKWIEQMRKMLLTSIKIEVNTIA